MDLCIYLFRLIDPQTQVTRLRVRWSLFLCLDGLRVGHVFQWISSVLLLSLLLQFPLSTVLQCSSHQDNKRLFGFILQSAGGRGDSRIVCYIFESNNDGEKVVCVCVRLFVWLSDTVWTVWPVCLLHVFQICDSIGLAKQIAFHSEMVRQMFLKLCYTES